MNEMATLHRAKTHSVRIQGVSFRCEPGSRREQILQSLREREEQSEVVSYFVAGLIASGFFLIGVASGVLV